jgi:hypothetical protein
MVEMMSGAEWKMRDRRLIVSRVYSHRIGCSAVQCSAVQCSAVQCSAVQCSAGWGPWLGSRQQEPLVAAQGRGCWECSGYCYHATMLLILCYYATMLMLLCEHIQ